MRLLPLLAAGALLCTGCAAEEPKPGPGWGPNPACAVTADNGYVVEVPCPPASADENPIRHLGESVEATLEDAEAAQKLLDAANALCAQAGSAECDVEALLNEKLPYLQVP